MVDVICIPCGMMNANCYIVHKQGEDTCILIDAAEDAALRAYLEQHNISPSHILLTHGHFDHILGVRALQKAYGAKVCIHAQDASMLESAQESLASAVRVNQEATKADRCLHDGDSIEASGLSVGVIHVPGHTPGGVCYVVEEGMALFTGDSLFRMSIGRTDLPGANGQALLDSIQTKLFTLNSDYTLYPGHMEFSKLFHEREHNPFVGRQAHL